MTLKEFKEIIEMSGEYKVEVIEGHSVQTVVFVFNSKGNTMCKFWGNSNFALDTIYMDNDEFLKEHWDTICEFAKTPIEERFPENLYYLRLNLPKSLEREPRYFTQVTTPTEQYCTLGHSPERTYKGMNFKTKFTAEEVEEIVTKEDMGCFSIVLPEEIEAI